jgi:hypothetical protein
VWNKTSGELMGTLVQHQREINGIAVNPQDSSELCSFCDDSSFIVYACGFIVTVVDGA